MDRTWVCGTQNLGSIPSESTKSPLIGGIFDIKEISNFRLGIEKLFDVYESRFVLGMNTPKRYTVNVMKDSH